jgi:hypothetical protein
VVRLKITRQPSGSIDGIQLDAFIVGFTYDVGTLLACYLLAERFAEPVPDESPALVTPLHQQVGFDVNALPRRSKVVSLPRQTFIGTRTVRDARSQAADRPPRTVRRKRT